MENINIGIINMIISNQLKESYFNSDLLVETNTNTNKFFNIIKESPILQLEFKIYKNIDNKHIENEILATRYIDNNINLFEIYTIEELETERAKLKEFMIDESKLLDDDKVKLYNSIDNLIKESLQHHANVNVDVVHESFATVLKHIKEPKINLLENDDVGLINEEVLEIAIEKFNKKYELLDENDKKLFQKLIKANDSGKKEIFETQKKESLETLEKLNKDNVKDNVTKVIQKINEMKYNKDKIINDIVDLYELKKELT